MPRKEALIEPPEVVEARDVEEEREFPVIEAITDGEVEPAPRYTSRVVIHDAWQYLGHAHDSPDWVDKNWIGWSPDDGLRQLPAGPCLKVPTPSGELSICRIGDYVAREEVLLATGVPGQITIKVWPQDTFHRMFIPRGG